MIFSFCLTHFITHAKKKKRLKIKNAIKVRNWCLCIYFHMCVDIWNIFSHINNITPNWNWSCAGLHLSNQRVETLLPVHWFMQAYLRLRLSAVAKVESFHRSSDMLKSRLRLSCSSLNGVITLFDLFSILLDVWNSFSSFAAAIHHLLAFSSFGFN